ncbi:MAG: hypothetical protein KGJ13_07390 [Patescibacteria group bacterium]|nr:hypothetical protein [Patescibacteria group bacterium]
MHGLKLPRKVRRVSLGAVGARIAWEDPITDGLVYLWLPTQYPSITPIFSGIGSPGTANLKQTLQSPLVTQIGGVAFGGGSAGGGVFSANTSGSEALVIPAAKGSLAMFLAASFSPTDSVAHYCFDISPGSGTPEFSFTKFSDNNWYFGWDNASDTRASGSAAGTFTAGKPFVAGGTWNSSHTLFYSDGLLRITKAASPSTFATNGRNLGIGIYPSAGGSNPWCTSTSDGMHWLAIWSRELGADEWRRLAEDPCCLIRWPQDDLGILSGPHVAPSFTWLQMDLLSAASVNQKTDVIGY